ncbi:hypothetical protein [Mycobacterium sp. IS-3022]|uniref:hypothetical protein n=1 Tax=Mycobacterium sp. IS-3022 TaxID=1772277 RepID=UPI00336AA83B
MTAAVLSTAAAGLGYLAVYRHERVDAAHAEIAEQGPRIVEQMLSYSKDTLAQDLLRGQSLTTDGYLLQLTAQQKAVRKASPANNEYWAVGSAVLSASEDQASMLLAMQGQRGTDEKDLKFITATVRVDFQKCSDGRWLVANLAVLKKPQMHAVGQ